MSRIAYISNRGLQLIKTFEGFSPTIYKDSAGLPSIGYGHLILPHEFSFFKNGITKTQSEDLLRADVRVAENAVSRLITSPINQNQFDSLTSFAFNLGTGALQRSSLRAKVNRAEHGSVPAEFLRWIYSSGRKTAGLIRRRQAEAELYIS